jgi:imidazolonepropionase-like amidohydrolase
MTIRPTALYATVALTLAVAAAARAAEAPGATVTAAAAVTALHCGQLLDSINGRMLGATTIVVEGGRIRDVTPGTAAPAGAKEIDLSTQVCLPGLIDSHVHLTMEFNKASYSNTFRWNVADYAVRSTVFARRTLMAGFTTVRNLADIANESVALRNAINEGVVVGPRIFTAGQAIGSTETAKLLLGRTLTSMSVRTLFRTIAANFHTAPPSRTSPRMVRKQQCAGGTFT